MKAAVIGCGRMGAEPSSRLEGKIPPGWLPISHVESLLAISEIESIALCDHDETLLKKRTEQYKINNIYTDYRRLIDDFQPELITIATRTPGKCDIIRYACENGVKGIYVEKPLANSLLAVKDCLAVVKKHGVKLAYGVNRRYHSLYRQARDMILNGEIGDVIEVVAEHGQAQLLWTHPHTVDLILFYLETADVMNIQASVEASTLVIESDLKINSDPVLEHAFFKFACGKTAIIERGSGINIRIAGSTGNLVVHADGSFIQINKSSGKQLAYYQKQQIIQAKTSVSATVVAITQLIQSICSQAPLPIDLEIIEIGTKMLTGCVWSALNENKMVSIHAIPDELVITGKYGDLYA